MTRKLNEKQLEAYTIATAGHNLFLSGQAGTGKTWLQAKIMQDLANTNNTNVAVTCATGIATQNFPPGKATTLHKWSGIQDGRYTTNELKRFIMEIEAFSSVKQRIMDTNVLIIDEISMISKKMFEQIEEVCRFIRGSNFPFGGIKILASGSFRQLAPVRNTFYGGVDYCFRSNIFPRVFAHCVTLTDVIRQDEPALIETIAETEKGILTDKSIRFIKSLNRPLQVPDNDIVNLFALKLDCFMHNNEMLDKLNTESKCFRSEDTRFGTGVKQSHIEQNIGLEKVVLLKVGVPVILTYNVNLSKGLVNGRRGFVVGFNDNAMTVDFGSPGLTDVNIAPFTSTIYNPISKSLLFQRVQIPLQLAWAITIHKAQGMSIRNVCIDCSGIFLPAACEAVMESMVQQKPQASTEELDIDKSMTKYDDIALSKIRYIGGACIVAIRKRLQRRNHSKPATRSICFLIWKLLRVLQIERSVISEFSEFKESLEETERKQNEIPGLTHITDDCFQFFVSLFDLVASYETVDNIHRHGSRLFDVVCSQVLSNSQMVDKWCALFSAFQSSADADDIEVAMMELFEDVILQFVRINHSNLRKTFKEHVKKTKALRKALAAPTEASTSSLKRTKPLNENDSSGSEKEEQEFMCPMCQQECINDPPSFEDQSIECHNCHKWLHYKCCSIKGTERFLKSEYLIWICSICKSQKTNTGKGKGRGKKSKKH